MFKKVFALTLCLGLALSLAVVGKAVAADPVFRIGYHRALFGSANVVAWKKGWFDEVGLKYTIHPFAQGKLMRQAILANSLDVGTTGFRPFVTAIAKGGKLKGIAVTSYLCGITRLLVRKDSPIKSMADLKGKRIAFGKATSVGFSFEHFMLPSVGLKLEDLVAINTVTTERIPALVSRSADVAIVIDPMGAEAIDRGIARSIADFCPYDKAAMMHIGNPRTIKSHPELFVKYLKAWLRAKEYARTNPDDFARTYWEELRSKGSRIKLSVLQEALGRLDWSSPVTDEAITLMNRMAVILKKQGKIKRVPDFKGGEGLELSLLKEAMM